jgi:hypothetical protein
MTEVPRRSFLKGVLALIAAPLVPKAELLATTPLSATMVRFIDPPRYSVAGRCDLAQIRELLMPGIRQIVSTYEVPPWGDVFCAE